MGVAHRSQIIAKRRAPAHRLGKQSKVDPKDWQPKPAKAKHATNWIVRTVNRIEA